MTKAVLLDLGNVVLGIDFHRVFESWAGSAGVDKERFYSNWKLDDAYKAHEVGAISFETYCDNLTRMFDVELSHEQWRSGWNALWTSPFDGVLEILPNIKSRFGLYAFTNTNDTHAACWRALYTSELADFEHIFVSSEIGERKPDVAAYHSVCASMGCKPEEVTFVDDTAENIEGAGAAGLKAIHARGEDEVAAALNDLLQI